MSIAERLALELQKTAGSEATPGLRGPGTGRRRVEFIEREEGKDAVKFRNKRITLTTSTAGAVEFSALPDGPGQRQRIPDR